MPEVWEQEGHLRARSCFRAQRHGREVERTGGHVGENYSSGTSVIASCCRSTLDHVDYARSTMFALGQKQTRATARPKKEESRSPLYYFFNIPIYYLRAPQQNLSDPAEYGLWDSRSRGEQSCSDSKVAKALTLSRARRVT